MRDLAFSILGLPLLILAVLFLRQAAKALFASGTAVSQMRTLSGGFGAVANGAVESRAEGRPNHLVSEGMAFDLVENKIIAQGKVSDELVDRTI